jgi:deoxyribonuclease V
VIILKLKEKKNFQNMTNLKTFNIEKARELQRKIAKKVILYDDFLNPPQTVAGLDVSYKNKKAFAVAVILDYKNLKLLENKSISMDIKFPYIPTLLSFREVKPLSAVIEKLEIKPDVFLVDAHGIAHPYFSGCASHLGVSLDIPTIGVAKKKLVGDYNNPANKKGTWTLLKYQDQIIGAVLRTKKDCKPLFISTGHKVSLKSALKIVIETTKKYKHPEPLRLAHLLTKKVSTTKK